MAGSAFAGVRHVTLVAWSRGVRIGELTPGTSCLPSNRPAKRTVGVPRRRLPFSRWEQVESHDVPEGGDAILPVDLLAFGVRPP